MNKFGSAKSFFATSLLSFLVFFSSLTAPYSIAQGPFSAPAQKDRLNNPFGQFNQGGPAANEKKVTFTAEFKVEKETKLGKLFVKAKIAPQWHVYSLHNPGNSLPTKLRVTKDDSVLQIGNFRSEKNPDVELISGADEIYFDEYHEDEVVWIAPIQFAPDSDPESIKLVIDVDGQVCSTACNLFSEKATATYAGELEPGTLALKQAVALPNIGAPKKPVSFQSVLKLKEGKDDGWIVVEAQVTPGYHLYSQQNTSGTLPLTIDLGDRKPFAAIGNFNATSQPHVYLNPDFKTFEESFDGKVKWIAPVKLAAGVDPESIDLLVAIDGQSCNDEGCQLLSEQIALNFDGYGDLGEVGSLAETNLSPEINPDQKAESKKGGSALNLDELDVVGAETTQYSFGMILLFALLGGFILNFMPCVLPVIGLKVMSFVNQAGKNRMQALTLNLWYVFGMLSVFMALATMAVVFNIGWGQQSQSVIFNIVMASVVFAMGLSFLGVWEIPIPGFVGTGKAAEVAQQEGPTAAIVKGIITTVLAVPCSGPGLATALTYSAGKPPWIVYSIFLFLGIGMALPYIVIGLKPDLVRFLPKPGPWMETFKQVMGFFLLATVVFIMSYIHWELRLATLAFLIGLWFCCWLVGRIPITASQQKKTAYWASATAFGIVSGFIAFTWIAEMSRDRYERNIEREITKRMTELDESPDLLHQVKNENVSVAELNWQPFSVRRLENETAESATVLVDFTADW